MRRRAIEPRDLFNVEFPVEFDVSDDGSALVYTRQSADIRTDRWHTNLWRIHLTEGRGEQLTSGAQRISGIRLDPQGQRVAYVSDVTGSAQIHVLELTTGRSTQLTDLPHGPLLPAWSHDGSRLAFYAGVSPAALDFMELPQAPAGADWADPPYATDMLPYKSDAEGYLERRYLQVFVVAADGGEPVPLTAGPYHHGVSTFVGARPVWTRDDSRIVFAADRGDDWEMDARGGQIYTVTVDSGDVTPLAPFEGVQCAPALSPDGTKLAFLGFENEGWVHESQQLHVHDLATGATRRLADADFGRDVAERLDNAGRPLVWSADNRGVYAMFDDQGATHVGFFALDGSWRVVAEGISSGVNGYSFPNGFAVDRGGRIFAGRSSLAEPAEVAMFASGGNEPRRLTSFNAGFAVQHAIGEREEIRWQNPADGQPLHGWLLRPPEAAPAGGYPLVLEIHGGPHANFGDRFWLRAQMFAARGYAVLLTNPRGSTSYGNDFARAIQHDYPGRDVDDLLSGIDHVSALDDIDGERLFVTGGSGGGVLTAALVARTDRFTAAACLYPVIDWTSFHLTTDIPAFVKWWFPAPPWKDPEHYAKRSLIADVENVQTPTLVMCGDADQRTPFGQAEMYYQALKLNGVETALVKFPGEAHGINRRPSHHAQAAAIVLNWFDARAS